MVSVQQTSDGRGESRIGERVRHLETSKRVQIPVLMYHAISQERSAISAHPQAFAWQMEWLHRNGFGVISLGTLLEHLLNRDTLPERAIAITFDDGFESVYTAAFPVLVRYGFTATVFLVAGHCGGHNDWPSQPAGIPRLPLLSWSQVEEMDHWGIEFGGHSFSHAPLDRLSQGELTHEILESKVSIEEHLGHSVQVFAYPYGRYDSRVKECVGQGYAGACTSQPALVTSASDPLELARIDAHYVVSQWVFSRLAHPLLPAYLAGRRTIRGIVSSMLRRQWR